MISTSFSKNTYEWPSSVSYNFSLAQKHLCAEAGATNPMLFAIFYSLLSRELTFYKLLINQIFVASEITALLICQPLSHSNKYVERKPQRVKSNDKQDLDRKQWNE